MGADLAYLDTATLAAQSAKVPSCHPVSLP